MIFVHTRNTYHHELSLHDFYPCIKALYIYVLTEPSSILLHWLASNLTWGRPGTHLHRREERRGENHVTRAGADVGIGSVNDLGIRGQPPAASLSRHAPAALMPTASLPPPPPSRSIPAEFDLVTGMCRPPAGRASYCRADDCRCRVEMRPRPRISTPPSKSFVGRRSFAG
jgi:hypothetical protein